MVPNITHSDMLKDYKGEIKKLAWSSTAYITSCTGQLNMACKPQSKWTHKVAQIGDAILIK